MDKSKNEIKTTDNTLEIKQEDSSVDFDICVANEKITYNIDETEVDKTLGRILTSITIILLIAALIAYLVIKIVFEKENVGARQPVDIPKAYMAAYNSGSVDKLSDFCSRDMINKEELFQDTENYINNSKMYADSLDSDTYLISTGDSYNESSRLATLTKYGYSAEKANDIKELHLWAEYNDKQGNQDAGYMEADFIVMEIGERWYLIDILHGDVHSYSEDGYNINNDKFGYLGQSGGSDDSDSGDGTEFTKSVVDMSQDIFSREIGIDGSVYKLPFSYNLISYKYTFENEDDANVILIPGEKAPLDYKLVSPGMDENVKFMAGFINDTNEDADLKDSKINIIRIDKRWTGSEVFPEVTLPGGITWGATAEDVEALYGAPVKEPSYNEEYGYTVYTYENSDNTFHADIVIYDELGMQEVVIVSY